MAIGKTNAQSKSLEAHASTHNPGGADQIKTALVVTKTNISYLPQTFSATNVTANMVVVNSTLSNPAAQTSDWTVTTTAGSITISGSISDTTDIELVLVEA